MFYDTTVFIHFLRHHDDATYQLERVRRGLDLGYCSVITEAELWAGLRDEGEELTAAEVLARFKFIPVTSSIDRAAGTLLKGKTSVEVRAHFRDALIAASAIEIRETILTADARSEKMFGNRATYKVYI